MHLELIYSPFKVSIWRSIIVATNLFVRKSSNTWAEFSSNKFLLPRRGNFMWIVTQKAPPPLPPRGENYRTKFSSIVLCKGNFISLYNQSWCVTENYILGEEIRITVNSRGEVRSFVPYIRFSLLQNVSTWKCTHHPCLTRSARSKSCARYDFRNSNVTGVWDWSRKALNILLLHFTSVSKQRFKPHGTATYS